MTTDRKPNIVFVHVDQLRQSAVGGYGSQQTHTPNIDRILADGVSFDRSHAAVPICVPARTCWYTGLEPEQSGVTTNGLHIEMDDVKPVDLGTWLRDQAGYDVPYMGKWHVAIHQNDCGFEYLHGSNPVGEYGDTAVARAAEDYLLNHQGEKPFFLSVGLLNPHDICYWSFEHTPAKFNLADRWKDRLPPLPPNLDRERGELKGWSDEQWQLYTHDYNRLVEMVDEEVGRIYRACRNSPRADNTVFIFSSDHGQGNGEHGYPTKGAPYEHSMRVPLVIVDPRARARRDTEHMVSGLDMAPTICDLAGVDKMPRNNGASLMPLVRGESPPWRERLAVASRDMHHRVIYQGDWKLIVPFKKPGDPMLFNIKDDPWEMNDRAADPECKAIYDELLAFRRQYASERDCCRQYLEVVGKEPGGKL